MADRTCGTCAMLVVIDEIPLDQGCGCYRTVKAGTCPYQDGSFRLGNRMACEDHEEVDEYEPCEP